MTVSSLWKALDRAGCGKSVGAKDIQDHCTFTERLTPWNVNETQKVRPTLAIDLSIWICEALSSTGMAKSHIDPPLHLVYARSLKLLNLGIKIIVVLEGKRRTRTSDGEDSFRKRRSGTRFWSACQRCAEMLGLLGIPVVRAKAEGEALCALLNQQGVVDGVISNDGDCFLYGAKVLYTKFTLENLEKACVMRYDVDNVRACVDDDDGDAYDHEREAREIVSLNRSDLISFAILTGSDVAGQGLPKVGCRKAIRFIKKCQLDNPLKRRDAARNELESWANAAYTLRDANNRSEADPEPEDNFYRRCSCCCHPGTKSSHKKNGCKMCGTEAGEPCFTVSPGGKFRSSLRAKALGMTPAFDPESVFAVYHHPNDNQIPILFQGKSSRSLQMMYPDLQGLLQSPLIIRGHGLAESRNYLQHSISCLLARTELLYGQTKNDGDHPLEKCSGNRTRPKPKQIKKAMVCRGKQCFEVDWIVNATVTDAEGKPMDEFEFSTIEDQTMIKRCYPKLVSEFNEEEREKQRQGTAEQEKRRTFLNLICGVADSNDEIKQKSDRRKLTERHFREGERGGQVEILQPHSAPQERKFKRPQDLEITFHEDLSKLQPPQIKRGQAPVRSKRAPWSDDADKLLRFAGAKVDLTYGDDGLSSINTESVFSAMSVERDRGSTLDSAYTQNLTPSHLHFLGSKHDRDPAHEETSHQPSKFPRTGKLRTILKEHHIDLLEPKPQSLYYCQSDPRPSRARIAARPLLVDARFTLARQEKRACPEQGVLEMNGDDSNRSHQSKPGQFVESRRIGILESALDKFSCGFIRSYKKTDYRDDQICGENNRGARDKGFCFEMFESKTQDKAHSFNNGYMHSFTEQVEERQFVRDEHPVPGHTSFKSRSGHASACKSGYDIERLLKEWEKDDKSLEFCHLREGDAIPADILQTAAEKLETKIRQANLALECFQQLGYQN